MKSMNPSIEMIAMKALVKRLKAADDGRFVWLDGQAKGKIAGKTRTDGYRMLRHPLGKRGQSIMIYEHRFVWFYHRRRLPNGQIDHINGDRSDNRIENLRDVTHRKNSQNAKKHRDGHLVGVSKVGRRFRSQASVGGRHIHFGYFDTAEEARDSAVLGRRKLGLV